MAQRGYADLGLAKKTAPTAPSQGTAAPQLGDTGLMTAPDFGTFKSPGYGGSMSPTIRLGDVPGFNAPEFNMPSFEDAQNDPGYQFRLASGQQALERAAAAKGRLRTGGTLKDLIEYGQNFGAQEYGNVFNRALQGYQQKYQGEWNKAQLAADIYKTNANIEAQRALAAFGREGEVWNGQRQAAQYADSRLGDILGQVYSG
jgi:hypothetical protein